MCEEFVNVESIEIRVAAKTTVMAISNIVAIIGEKGYPSVYFERDDSLKSNTYSLCNSAACVLNGVNFESI